MLEKTEGTIKYGQPRDTGSIRNKIQNKHMQNRKHNTENIKHTCGTDHAKTSGGELMCSRNCH
jgi:hypothetical protein